MATLKTPIEELPRIGPRYVLYLNKLGIKTAGDLLFHFPFRYDDFSDFKKISEVEVGQVATIRGEISEIQNVVTPRKRMALTCALVKVDSGTIQAIWFNQTFITNSLKKGMNVSMSGKITYSSEGIQIANPAYEVLEKSGLHTGRFVPIYHETEGVSSKWLRAHIKPLIKLADSVPEFLPEEILERQDLLGIGEAIKQIHFPDDAIAAELAKRRLAFNELFWCSSICKDRGRNGRDRRRSESNMMAKLRKR
jgi:ATP-dependent DNA helicase RecG